MLGEIAIRRARMRDNHTDRMADLRLAFESSFDIYVRDSNQYYSGIRAVNAAVLLDVVYRQPTMASRARELLPMVRTSVALAQTREPDYWSAAG